MDTSSQPLRAAAPLTRRSTLNLLAAGTAGIVMPGFARAATATPSPAAGLLDDVAWNLLDHSPEQATSLGVDTGAHAALRGELADRSPQGCAKLADTLRADLARVQAVDESALDASTRTSLGVVRSAYTTALDGLAQPYGDVAVGGWRNTPYVVIQNVGAYLDTPKFLDADHPVKNSVDAEAYLSRLGQFDGQLDGELERMRSATDMGLVPPDFLLDRTITQMTGLIADAKQGGGDMVQSLVKRTAAIPGNWDTRAQAIVSTKVVPALERQLAEIKRQRGLATSAPGMRERPHGSEFYDWALRASTTTTVPAEEMHRIGVAQLAEITHRMDITLRQLGYTQGSVVARAIAIQKDPRYTFPAGDEGRKAIVAYMEEQLAFIRTRLPLAFRRLVSSKVEIRRLPIAEEAGAPPAYGGPGTIDGSVPGRVWVNLGDTSMHNKVIVPDLVFHEGLPGHVWQGNYAQKLPLIRSMLAFNAYSEGWALYAEQLADELGAYDAHPAGRVGYLAGLAWRAVRLIVDTGLHAQGWSRDKALSTFVEATGLPMSTAASEIDRYCSWPGQACGYKMGHNQINRLRDQAKSKLASAYDLRDFDQAVVDGGNVPLDVLASNVERYIAARQD